jgi:large subunit ribosomal protein L5
MEVPKIQKIVVNCCIGSSVDTKVALEDAFNEIQMITGQKPIKTKSTKSIANFKLREDQEIGVKVTLRGQIMYEFLERLIRTALPRIRDFRGISPRAFDGRGNYTLGVKDQTIFPEIELDKVKRNLGMDITIVTTARKNEEAKELLALFGMPFSDRKLPTAQA